MGKDWNHAHCWHEGRPLTGCLTYSSNMYCTGDLGRWRADGNIDILGRLDDQVKIKVCKSKSNKAIAIAFVMLKTDMYLPITLGIPSGT